MVNLEKNKKQSASGVSGVGTLELSSDLTRRFGKGFGPVNLSQMRKFYLCWSGEKIFQTLSEKSGSARKRGTLPGKLVVMPAPKIFQTPSEKFDPNLFSQCFPLPWSAYVSLLSVKDEHARNFYETEALRGGWSVRQLDRQINSMFYERTALSKNKASMLNKNAAGQPGDILTPEEEIKDHFVLEFTQKGDSLAHYALEGLPNKVLAAEYRTVLPEAKKLEEELNRTRTILEHRKRNRAVIVPKPRSSKRAKNTPLRGQRWQAYLPNVVS